MDNEQSYTDYNYELSRDDPATCPIQFLITEIFSNDLYTTGDIVRTESVFRLFLVYQMIRRFLHWILLGR